MNNEYNKHLTVPIRKDRKPLQELIPLSQPLRVFIDPSDICNFKCQFCFQAYDKSFKGCVMSMELFEKIVEQLQEFDEPINVVHLYGLGEPLLNKDLPLYIKMLKEKHVAKEVAITSNGSRLTHEMSEALVDAGLDRLSISLNGLEDKHFKDIVGNGEVCFNKMYEEIQYFYRIRKQCHLHIKINGDCFSEDDQKRFIELFKGHSDTLNIDNVVNVWSGLSISKDESKKMYQSKDIEVSKRVCPQMFYELMIHSDGRISPCCVDYNYKIQSLGSVEKNSIKEIWQGEFLRQLQKDQLAGEAHRYKICEECDYPDCASTVDITPYKEEIMKKLNS